VRLTLSTALCLLLIPCLISAQESDEAGPTPIPPGAGLGIDYSFASPNSIALELHVATRSGIIGGLQFGGFFNGDTKPTFADFEAPDSNVTVLGWYNDPELFLMLAGGWGFGHLYATYSVGVSQQPSVYLVESKTDNRAYKNDAVAEYRFMHGLGLHYLFTDHFKASLAYVTRRKWVAGLGVKF